MSDNFPVITPYDPAGGSSPTCSTDLLLADWEFLRAESIVLTYLDRIMSAGWNFKEILSEVRGYALDDGQGHIASALEERALAIEMVMNTATEIYCSLRGQAEGFINRVDEIDDFMYGGY